MANERVSARFAQTHVGGDRCNAGRGIGQRHGARSGSGPARRHGGWGGAERNRGERRGRTIHAIPPRGPRRPEHRRHLHVGGHGADLRSDGRRRGPCQFDRWLDHGGDDRENARRHRRRHRPRPRRPDWARRHGKRHSQCCDRSALAVPDGDQRQRRSVHGRRGRGLQRLYRRSGHDPRRFRRPGHSRLAGSDRPQADRQHLGGRYQRAVARPQPGFSSPSARVDRGTDAVTQRHPVRRCHHQRHHRDRWPLRRPADGRRGPHSGGRHGPRELGGESFGHGHR